MNDVSPCPNCGGRTLYRGPETSAGGGHAPNYLPGLGTFLPGRRPVFRFEPRNAQKGPGGGAK